jgi:hypothetical protein
MHAQVGRAIRPLPAPEHVSARDPAVLASQWAFYSLCFYVLAQGYLIPLLRMGPSWGIWPSLPDVAVLVMVLAWLNTPRRLLHVPPTGQPILRTLVKLLLGAAVSYLVVTRLFVELGLRQPGLLAEKGVQHGLFQVYKLAQFVFVFWVALRIPMTAGRLRVLRQIAIAVLLWICTTSVLNYLEIVPVSQWAGQIPADLAVAGPWGKYNAFGAEYVSTRGCSVIGWNHGYTSAQILLLVGLALVSSPGPLGTLDMVLGGLAALACFCTTSRAGLLSIILYLGVVSFRNRHNLLRLGIALALVCGLMAALDMGGKQILQPWLVERQAALLRLDRPENLSGRSEMWTDRVAFVLADPRRLILGEGFGSAVERDLWAHNNYLHVVLETGLIGLVAFVAFFWRISRTLYLVEAGPKPLFWATMCFLVASFSEELLYPIVTFGHFIGFYLCCLAIALNAAHRGQPPAHGCTGGPRPPSGGTLV